MADYSNNKANDPKNYDEWHDKIGDELDCSSEDICGEEQIVEEEALAHVAGDVEDNFYQSVL